MKNDRQAKRLANLQVVDLTSPEHMQPWPTPFIMTFSATGNVIQSPTHQSTTQRSDLPTLLSQNPSNSSLNSVGIQRPTINTIAGPSMGIISDTTAGTTVHVDNDIVVLETWSLEESEAQFKHRIPQTA